MNNITLRHAVCHDAAGIIAAHIRSIREICSTDYSPEQVEAWSGINFKESTWCHTIARDKVWVLESSSVIMGFGHLRIPSDEAVAIIEGLYFAPEAKGHGFGRQLIKIMYAEVAKTPIKQVVLQSTLTSEGFYKTMGFSAIGETAVSINGVSVPCVDMVIERPFSE